MNLKVSGKLKLGEKIGYALGDTAANITWRSLTTFLMVFYTDVFGIPAAAAGVILLVARSTDGITDVIMGMIADRTKSKYGKFRPWILWTAIPLGIIMVLTFTTPNLSVKGKIIYAYATYILLTLIYTLNNVPYSALMGVMTGDHEERTSISSFRFAGAFLGGIITQGFLIYLVEFLGGGNENRGYQYSMYLFAGLLVLFLFITFYSTKERVQPPKSQNTNILKDLRDLLTNKPWIIILVIGLLFQIFNAIKQGVTVYYFERFLGNKPLAAVYMVVLLLASMAAALLTTPMAKMVGKKNLFIYALLFSGLTTGMIHFATFDDIGFIFTMGTLAEFGAGIMPVLFFAMLGDAADFSEFKNNRRATGLFYSAGTLSLKFGGGVGGAIIGFVLAHYGYNAEVQLTIDSAIPGIKILMSWIPAIFTGIGVLIMLFYPLSKSKMEEIGTELKHRRRKE
ncbi:MAG: MFS transporter [Bacteroidales bacterium]|nr:MFS transporter [Bacteroidales bacterium]